MEGIKHNFFQDIYLRPFTDEGCFFVHDLPTLPTIQRIEIEGLFAQNNCLACLDALMKCCPNSVDWKLWEVEMHMLWNFSKTQAPIQRLDTNECFVSLCLGLTSLLIRIFTGSIGCHNIPYQCPKSGISQNRACKSIILH